MGPIGVKMTENKRFTITKRIAKHGRQVIIVIPKILEEHLSPGTIVELNISVIGGENA
jgi:hypothetical protein